MGARDGVERDVKVGAGVETRAYGLARDTHTCLRIRSHCTTRKLPHTGTAYLILAGAVSFEKNPRFEQTANRKPDATRLRCARTQQDSRPRDDTVEISV
jgi:hypothetical protein